MGFSMSEAFEVAKVSCNPNKEGYVLAEVYNFNMTSLDERRNKEMLELPEAFKPVLQRVTAAGFKKVLIEICMTELRRRDQRHGGMLAVTARTVTGLRQMAERQRNRVMRECRHDFGALIERLSKAEEAAQHAKDIERVLPELIAALAK